MTQAKKKIMRRKAAQCIGHLMKAIECIIEIREFFLPFHADYSEMFELTCSGIMFIMEEFKSVCIKAWGYFPDDLNKWLK